MKILVLGAYGRFGGRLCELLAADQRLSLLIAGRSLQRAQALCQTLPPGAQRQAIIVDRDTALGAQLQRLRPDLLIDASGPFQSYGAAPYRVVRACLDNGVNYMDLADGASFVQGIRQFDAAAKERKLYLLSGVSTCPALTAAAVRQLSRDMCRVIAIKGGIAPSPHSRVGLNVIRAIAGYAGKPVQLVRDGRPAYGHALTETARYTISPPGHIPLDSRCFSLVEVPDLQVLPGHWPELDAIWMGAGPVPAILHRVLRGWAWLVRLRLLPSLSTGAPLFHRAVNLLGQGEPRGGMFVEVHGARCDGSAVTRSWHLLAEGDDGPYIPCMALAALVRRTLDGRAPQAGARPASGELELADYAPWFAARAIFTGEREWSAATASATLFQHILGSAWNALPAAVQAVHAGRREQHLSGRASVERGGGWLARIVAAIFRFPAAGADVAVSVSMQPRENGETWRRNFGGRVFSSTLSAGAGRAERLLLERFGPFSIRIALVVEGGKLRLVVRGWSVCGMPLPRRWAPGGDSYEYAQRGQFCFHIEIRHPLTGLIVGYSGRLAPAEKKAA